MFVSARRVAARLGLTDGPIVCYQGAMVADLAGGEVLQHQRIDAETAAEVVREVRRLGRHLNAYVDDGLYVEEMDDWARTYAEHAEVGIESVGDLEALVRERPPTKFVVLSEPADVDVVLPLLQDLWRGRLYVVRSQASYIEIADPGVSKSGALSLAVRAAARAAASARWRAATATTTSTCCAGRAWVWPWRRRRRTCGPPPTWSSRGTGCRRSSATWRQPRRRPDARTRLRRR